MKGRERPEIGKRPPRVARQQVEGAVLGGGEKWWALQDSNLRPNGYEPSASIWLKPATHR